MAEEERLVEDWSEVGLGMLVAVRPCQRCGARHRGQVIKWSVGGPFMTSDFFGELVPDPGSWEVVPTPACYPPKASMVVTPRLVKERRLYRVVDGLDLSKETREERVKELVKR